MRKSGTAVLAAITMTVSATVAAIVFSAQATAQPVDAVPTAITATAAPLVRMQCGSPSTNTMGFQPYLSLITQPTQIQRTTAYRNCSAPGFPNIRSGYETKTNFINDDCVVMLLGGGNATFNIIWNTTQTTTFVGARTANLSGNTFTVTYTGNVTAGLFTGSGVRQVFKADATEINKCLAGTGLVPFTISDVTLTIF
jgi:hypothetical protein